MAKIVTHVINQTLTQFTYFEDKTVLKIYRPDSLTLANLDIYKPDLSAISENYSKNSKYLKMV